MFEAIALCVASLMGVLLPEPDYLVLTPADLDANCPTYIENRSAEALLCPVRGRKTIGVYSVQRDLVIALDGKSLTYTVAHEATHRVQHHKGVDTRSPEAEDEAIRIGMECRR